MVSNLNEVDKIIEELNNYKAERVDLILENASKTPKTYTTEQVILLFDDIIKSNRILKEKLQKISKILGRNYGIYFDKKIFKLSNNDLEIKYGITTRRINQICKNIEKNKKVSK